MENLIQRINHIRDRSDSYQLFLIFEGLYERLRSQTLTDAGLAATGASSPTVEAANVVYATARGVLVTEAAGTDMPALSGTVTNGSFNVFVFTIDSGGNLYTQMGTEGGSLGAVRWPDIDQERAIIGFVIINPTGTGNFVGGTTNLDDATVVPNAVYVNTQGAFDPTAYTGV